MREAQHFPKISECARGGFTQRQSYLAILNYILNFHRLFERCSAYSNCSKECNVISHLAESS